MSRKPGILQGFLILCKSKTKSRNNTKLSQQRTLTEETSSLWIWTYVPFLRRDFLYSFGKSMDKNALANASEQFEACWSNLAAILKQCWSNVEANVKQFWSKFKAILKQRWSNFKVLVKQVWSNFEAILK